MTFYFSLAWKDSRDSQIDGVSPENGESSKDQIPEGGTVLDDDNSNEIPNKSLEVKLEDKNRDEKRSAHYLITDYWNSLEGFFGSLEMAKDRSIGDFTRPVVPLPQKVWQLKTEPTTQVCLTLDKMKIHSKFSQKNIQLSIYITHPIFNNINNSILSFLKEPMWTFATPTAVVCKQETNNNNFLSCPPTNQNVTKT